VNLRALIFDVDGTLADTEEVHRQAFNDAFRAHGINWHWDSALYAQLLATTGGKERLLAYLQSLALPENEETRLRALVPAIHATKTRAFAVCLASGDVALRPGVARLIREARAAQLRLAIASTTTLANVEALLSGAPLADGIGSFDVIATGDVVARKKPSPDIYLHALRELDVPAASGVAFEDSEPGVRAATLAGLFTVATPTAWSRDHDFSAANLLLPSLGEPGDQAGTCLDLATLKALHAASSFQRHENRHAAAHR